MYEVTMPKLSDSMEVGKILAWKVAEGDAVHEGDVLAEIESDKAAMELECFQDGVMGKIVKPNDAEVQVGEVIGYIATGDEAKAAAKPAVPAPKQEAGQAPPPKAEAPAPAPAAPPAKKAEKPAPKAPAPPKPEAKPPAPVAPRPPAPRDAAAAPPAPAAAPPPPPPAAEARGRAVRISPYARKLAAKLGVDYTRIEGTGVGGRIMARDVEEVAGAGAAGAAGAPKPSADEELPPVEVAEDEAEIEEASFRLKTQARRVVASKHVIPHFYMTASADVTALLARKDALKEKYGATVTHLVMLACLKAIAAHPEVNRTYDRGRVIKWKGVNLGLAIQTDQGLTVAVLRGADRLSLEGLVKGAGEVVGRARAGRLSADDRRHPTFTISNLGMYGVEHFEPIINPPSAVTLAVAAALPAPVVRGEAIYIAQVMRVSASCDHRIIEGVMAAKFLQDLTALLEDPGRLLAGQ